jgi:type VI protein secretion system component VasK
MNSILSLLRGLSLSTLFDILVASLIVIIIITILNTLVLIDCAHNEPKEWSQKNKWIIIISAIPFGWLAYIIFRRPKRIAQFGK